MNYFNENDDYGCNPIRFYHVCTDGEDNGIVYTSENDYRQAVTISAICAYKADVKIVCFCHMSTHSHFVIWSDSYDKAECFSNSFKRDYSRYFVLKYRADPVYCGISAKPILIADRFYLMNCIAYVLNNPVAAKITSRAEDYRWSSFNAYFNESSDDSVPIEHLGVRNIRNILQTKTKLQNSGFRINTDGSIHLKSYIDYGIVERIYGGKKEFYRSMAMTDSAVEEMRYVSHVVRFTDTELYAEALEIARRKYSTNTLNLLTKERKIALVIPLQRKTKASVERIARILRISPKEVKRYAGLIEDVATPSEK